MYLCRLKKKAKVEPERTRKAEERNTKAAPRNDLEMQAQRLTKLPS
jgi:hypothetical protein